MKLIREILLSGFAGDANMLDPANFPAPSTSIGGAAVPGFLVAQAQSSGTQLVVLLVDGSGNAVTPSGTFNYRIVEKLGEAVSSGSQQDRTVAGPTLTGAVVGIVQEHVVAAKGVPRGNRKITVQVTSAFAGLPGGAEVRAQIWARSV